MQDRQWTVFYPSQDGTGEGVMMQLPPVQRNVPAQPSPAQPSPVQPSPGLLPNSSKAGDNWRHISIWFLQQRSSANQTISLLLGKIWTLDLLHSYLQCADDALKSSKNDHQVNILLFELWIFAQCGCEVWSLGCHTLEGLSSGYKDVRCAVCPLTQIYSGLQTGDGDFIIILKCPWATTYQTWHFRPS